MWCGRLEEDVPGKGLKLWLKLGECVMVGA